MLERGEIKRNGTPAELLNEIKGCVYENMIDKEEVEYYNVHYPVSGLMSGADKIKVRYICTDEQAGKGNVVEPNLEDYYLYIFGNRG